MGESKTDISRYILIPCHKFLPCKNKRDTSCAHYTTCYRRVILILTIVYAKFWRYILLQVGYSVIFVIYSVTVRCAFWFWVWTVPARLRFCTGLHESCISVTGCHLCLRDVCLPLNRFDMDFYIQKLLEINFKYISS